MQRNNLQEENAQLMKKLEEEKELKLGLEKIIFGAADALKKVLSVNYHQQMFTHFFTINTCFKTNRIYSDSL